MMVMHANHPLQINSYDAVPKGPGEFDCNEWFNAKKGLKEENPLINLPYIKVGDVVVSQTNACFLYLGNYFHISFSLDNINIYIFIFYLGRKLNMLGSNESELIECEQLLCEIMDIRNSMVQFAYGTAKDKDTASTFVQSNNGNFGKLELWLQRQIKLGKSDGTTNLFLVGSSATAPDFHLFEMLVQFHCVGTHYSLPSFFEHFPLLHTFYDLFQRLPQNQKYFNSKLVKLPFNNKMAKFGATVSNEPWDFTKPYDKTLFDVSGHY